MILEEETAIPSRLVIRSLIVFSSVFFAIEANSLPTPIPETRPMSSHTLPSSSVFSAAVRTFAESVDAEHRGEAGANGAVLLLTYAGVPGTPTSIPAKGEKPEY